MNCRKPRRPWVAAITLAAALAASANARAEKYEFKQCVETALAQNPDLAISQIGRASCRERV